MDERQARIVKEFEALPGWEERYERLIQLGAALPPYPDEWRGEALKVKGCQSQVWLHARLEEGKVVLDADSDALIVKGLIALLLRVYSGLSPDAILATRPEFVEAIGMRQHLSPTRANGLAAMVKQIQLYALAFRLSAPASA
ncbi:MAG: SufE family protein [bacterium]|jgi:cysteine desulfuration protein SufE|nr:SufE family protein [bacterium]